MTIRAHKRLHHGSVTALVKNIGYQAFFEAEVEAVGMMEMGMFLLHQINLYGALMATTGPPI